jgi:hypothetical protein
VAANILSNAYGYKSFVCVFERPAGKFPVGLHIKIADWFTFIAKGLMVFSDAAFIPAGMLEWFAPYPFTLSKTSAYC